MSHPLFTASDLPGFQGTPPSGNPPSLSVATLPSTHRSILPTLRTFAPTLLAVRSRVSATAFVLLSTCQTTPTAGSPSPIASNTMSVPLAPLHLRPNPQSHPLRTGTPPDAFFFLFLSLCLFFFACRLIFAFETSTVRGKSSCNFRLSRRSPQQSLSTIASSFYSQVVRPSVHTNGE